MGIKRARLREFEAIQYTLYYTAHMPCIVQFTVILLWEVNIYGKWAHTTLWQNDSSLPGTETSHSSGDLLSKSFCDKKWESNGGITVNLHS